MGTTAQKRLSLLRRHAMRKSFSGTGIGIASAYMATVFDGISNNMKKSIGLAKINDFIKAGSSKFVFRPFGAELLSVTKNFEGGVKSSGEPIRKDATKLTEGSIMDIENILTTKNQDRDGDILEPAGAVLDEKMPLLWQHLPNEPIGKFVQLLKQDDEFVKTHYAIADTKAGNDAAILVEFGALRFSHGFKPLKFEPIETKDADADGGWHIIKYEVMEGSLVSIPANMDAVITAQSRKKLKSALIGDWAEQMYQDRQKFVKSGWGGGVEGSGQTINFNINLGNRKKTKVMKTKEEEIAEAERKKAEELEQKKKKGKKEESTPEGDNVVDTIIAQLDGIAESDEGNEIKARASLVSSILGGVGEKLSQAMEKMTQLGTAKDVGGIAAIGKALADSCGAEMQRAIDELSRMAEVSNAGEETKSAASKMAESLKLICGALGITDDAVDGDLTREGLEDDDVTPTETPKHYVDKDKTTKSFFVMLEGQIVDGPFDNFEDANVKAAEANGDETAPTVKTIKGRYHITINGQSVQEFDSIGKAYDSLAGWLKLTKAEGKDGEDEEEPEGEETKRSTDWDVDGTEGAYWVSFNGQRVSSIFSDDADAYDAMEKLERENPNGDGLTYRAEDDVEEKEDDVETPEGEENADEEGDDNEFEAKEGEEEVETPEDGEGEETKSDSTPEYMEGYGARARGRGRETCPYDQGTDEATDWLEGFDDALADDGVEKGEGEDDVETPEDDEDSKKKNNVNSGSASYREGYEAGQTGEHPGNPHPQDSEEWIDFQEGWEDGYRDGKSTTTVTKSPRDEGSEAFWNSVNFNDNPYPDNTDEAREWNIGWGDEAKNQLSAGGEDKGLKQQRQGLEQVFSNGHQYADRIYYDSSAGQYYDAYSDVYLDIDELPAFGIRSGAKGNKSEYDTNQAYRAGWLARDRNEDYHSGNPYDNGTQDFLDWQRGWYESSQENG